ncbi:MULTISPECIES: amidohydrolase family protein [Pacificibacter]|uniref:amidohydrolase family protein n=1 Tax=Pacificibacter TaxID=1042323 RepID=UPI001C0911B2|nr:MULTISPECIES: amidohydrolase [Pacificibacter]MBU2935559.1 amidohydrolase [Pacificibacter marinus]MDO6614055.1 amidohydrolase [Pacificibacter sp. 1_MG-2023]
MTVDIAIINGTVMPMGDADVIERGTVTIKGTKIAQVGAADAIDISGATKVIDANNCVIMPGFCNSHTHIASNMLLRGLLEDVRLFEWLSTMWTLKQNFDPDTLYWASMNGLVEMVKSGITSFNEHFDAYAVEPQIEALKVIPLRATLGYGFADRGIYKPITDWSWKTLHGYGDLVAQHHHSNGGLLQIGLSPHATYSCGAEMYQLVREVADAHGVPIHTHLAEGPQENAYVQETYGTSPVRWLHSLGFLKSDVTAAHCTQLDDEDARILAETGTKIAHCPVCNAKLSSGTLHLKCVQDHGVTVGLATDGPASHNSLDMFQEMKFASIIHKDKTGDAEFLQTHQVLEMATAEGAKAMNRPETGQLAQGMAADVIVVNLDTAHTMPVYDPVATLVYSSRADDVVHTIVAGRVLMENRVVIGIDEAEVRANFRAKAHALRTRSLG